MGVPWWLGASTLFAGTSAFFWSIHYWNEGYRQRGEVHPITKWIESHMETEEYSRQKRIEALERELIRADRRLQAIHSWFPSLRPRPSSTPHSNDRADQLSLLK